MQSQVDPLSPILVQVKVEIPWSQVSEKLETAYRNLQRTARVRGFRPGKVPRNVVKNLMGKNVERDVSTELAELGIGEAIKQHSIDAVAVSKMDSPALVEGQSWNFTAELEVRPKIEKVDLGALRVARKQQAVTDADVDAEIAQLREQNAELVTPEPSRPARQGDTLLLDIEVSVEGHARPDLSSTDTRTELGSERLLPAIEEALQGSSVGDERAAEMTFPDDYGQESLRGKAARFELRVKQVQQKVLPDIDDDFAKDLEHESLAAMRATIREQLEAQAVKAAEADLREQVVDKLVDGNPVPVPHSLVERQERAMMGELYQLQQMLGRPLPFDEKMHAELHGRAERKVRAGLLFGAIVDQQKIEVTDAEVDAKLEEIATQSGKHIAKVRADYQGERRESLQNQLLQNKLLEYLLSQATISDGATDEPAAAAPSAEAEQAETEAGEKQAAGAKKKAKPKSKDKEESAKPKAKKKAKGQAAG
ncbi:MAG: trigger factor [Polyangiales bacterium]